MPNAKFYVGNFTVIIIALLILGNLGMANDIYGDDLQIYDSSIEEEDPGGNSFDIDRIRYSPDIRIPTETDPLTEDMILNQTDTLEILTDTRISYDGETIEDTETWSEFEADGTNYGHDYAAAQYDVSDRHDSIIINIFGEEGDPVFITGVKDDEQVKSQQLEVGTGWTGNLNEVDVFEVIIVDESTEVDFSGERLDEGGITGAANIFIRFITTSYDYIAELPSLMWGYIGFTLAIPGLLGTFMRLYIGALFFVFIVLELWIG